MCYDFLNILRYYLETERNGVKDFLQCRTVGLCMSHNRLLNFHVVRSTRPLAVVNAVFAVFVFTCSGVHVFVFTQCVHVLGCVCFAFLR